MMADTSEGETGAPQTPPGPATDATGQTVFDPSKNVLDLVEAGNRRQDDLREAEGRHLREILALRAQAGEHERKCGEEIADLRADHNHELADIRARHDLELRRSEADRIDAIRRVDVEAVQRAAEVQATQATALAAQVAQTAEAMRTQVGAAQQAAATTLTAAMEPIQKDIQDLRKAQYEAQGQKTNVVETQARGANTGLWVGAAIAGAALFLGLIATAVTLAVSL